MEHRIHKRQLIELMVKLVIGGRVGGVSRTLEISSGGACIYNPGINLKKGKIISVDFIKHGSSKQVNCCLRAKVVHCSPAMIGLMFANEFGAYALVKQAGWG